MSRRRFPEPALDDSAPVAVSADQAVAGLVIALPRGAVISGRVVDEAGNPMALVPVSAQEVLAGERRRSAFAFSMGASTRTDDTGAFRLFGLRSGEFVLAAQAPRSSPLRIDPGAAAASSSPFVYYPGTAALKEATRIRMEEGDELGPLVFTFPPVPVFTVRAVVVDPGGQPAALVSVSLRSADLSGPGMSMMSRTSSSDGTVDFPRVPPGEYALSVAHYGPREALFAWVPITVAADVDELPIRLQRGASVKGRIIFEGGAPAAPPSMYIRSIPAKPGGANASVMPGPDLSFTLANQHGPILIRADQLPPGWHLKSVLMDGRDVTDSAIEFAVDGPPLAIVLSRSAATLSGVVTTAQGVPAESSILLINDELSGPDRTASVRRAMTSSDGKYRLEALRAGRYLVIATIREDGFMSTTTDEYVNLLAGYATRVLINDGEVKRLDLTRVALK